MNRIGSTFLIQLTVLLTLVSCNKHERRVLPITHFAQDDSTYIRVMEASNQGKLKESFSILSPYLLQFDLNNDLEKIDPRIAILAGNMYYSIFNLDSAIYYWKITHQISELLLNDTLGSLTTTNLGVAYLQKGYINTAYKYFSSAKKQMEVLNITNENYYTTCFNIASVLFSLKLYDEVNSQLNDIKNVPYDGIKFLYYIKKSELAVAENNTASYLTYLDSAKNQVKKVKIYQPTLELHELFSALELKDTAILIDYVDKNTSLYADAGLDYQLIFEQAYLLLHQKLYCGLEKFMAIEKQFNDEITENQILYFTILADYYATNHQYEQERLTLKKLATLKGNFHEQSHEILLKDINVSSMIFETDLLKAENNLKILQLEQRNNIFFYSAIILVLISLFVSYYMLRVQKLKAILKTNYEKLVIFNASLEESKAIIEQKLIEEKHKLYKINQTLKKTAILKKQLGNFFKEMDSQPDEKPIAKKTFNSAKINFYAFFKNHQDLALISLNDNDTLRYVDYLKNSDLDFNENEFQILSLILSDFTTPEIATLMNYTAKNIEYHRSQIRKKLQIQEKDSIKEYCKSQIEKLKNKKI
jgi:DNA-binding CsgD family transcriptional regulator